jgi:hypothetical protein
MNIQEIEEQIKALQAELEKLKGKQENKKWKLERGIKYYFATHFGVVGTAIYEDSSGDKWCIQQGNCFQTEEQAEQYLENLKTKAELRALADELNGDRIIDWEHYNPTKYSIMYDYGLKTISLGTTATSQDADVIYCLDENFADIASERIGEKRIINMIKAGV